MSALSPFDILFAQTVRQYSLLTVAMLLSGWLLLRAMRLKQWQHWGYYSLACAVGLYTHLFFSLVLLSHGTYVASQVVLTSSTVQPLKQKIRLVVSYGVSSIGIIVLYIPWIVAILTGGERTYQSSDWLSSPISFLELFKFWTLSFSSLFFDLDLGFNHPGTYLLRLPFIALILIALHQVSKNSAATSSKFILTSVMVPFLALALPDLLFGGRRSAITRYLICSFPGIQLAVAYVVGTHLPKRRFWQGIWAMMLIASITSCVVSAYSFTWWSKGVSVANAKTAAILNRMESPLVISDYGDSYLNQGNLISLSHILDADVQLLLVNPDAIAQGLAQVNFSEHPDVLLYAPSGPLRDQTEAAWGTPTLLDPPEANVLKFEAPQLN
ncbi:MAG: hypothetical protein AAFY17_16705 [Cyanobacteria bacterium J06642_11]